MHRDAVFLHSQAKLLFQSFDHVDSLEQGYSINFIWGPDYRLEHLKGAKGVGGGGGAVPIFFWGANKIGN